jgi:hypothetical protein
MAIVRTDADQRHSITVWLFFGEKQHSMFSLVDKRGDSSTKVERERDERRLSKLDEDGQR